MACATSALDLPLHANLGVMAQRHRRLLRQAHQPAPQTWRVPIRRGTPSCNRALHRRDQRRSQTLRLDGTRKPHPRCCQTRERKVRVDPLDAGRVKKAIEIVSGAYTLKFAVTPEDIYAPGFVN